jgi:hypothetical protein
MAVPRPEDFGLSERLIEEVRANDRRQGEVFVYLLLRGVGAAFLALTAWIYARSFAHAPLGGLLVAPLLGALGAAIAGLPIAVLSALVSWLLHPRHALSGALERYEAATADVRVCDVCRLAKGDASPKPGVAWCSRCGAWLCPVCRDRYDLRAIAALKRAAGGSASADYSERSRTV